MAKRGRKPKPDTVKILEGTRADRIGPPVPKPPQRALECPGHLEDDERIKWFEVIEDLEQAGILEHTDTDLVALYCVVWVRWVNARRECQESVLVSTALGGVKANPAVSIATQAEAKIQSLQEQLGLTPESRIRLGKLNPTPPTDEMDEFLARNAT